ncbi:hypothetical protein DD594_27940, partial [Enterobacter cloacae complex sp. 4DZ1-17B1]|uniref:hypothetical protein n=1 Tax=Enterobacter cloacae complex sp. 4DZ1-17B1 TaxID=2511991 RepID=UPI00102682B0
KALGKLKKDVDLNKHNAWDLLSWSIQKAIKTLGPQLKKAREVHLMHLTVEVQLLTSIKAKGLATEEEHKRWLEAKSNLANEQL